MNVNYIHAMLPPEGQRMVEEVILRELRNISAAVARECGSPDGELPLNLLKDLSSAASLYRTILVRMRTR
ncbi:MAG TPA: hypothetical protein VNM37_12455 [Candidatus Dormibacteraeota bacterium]|jgi:hypothetical protein|nr:hypothetical protein [Candidatus Dormibacteraeota bacterium]